MEKLEEKYCEVCGTDVKSDQYKRFGKYFCSEEHMQRYVERRQAQFEGEPKQQSSWWQRRGGGGCC